MRRKKGVQLSIFLLFIALGSQAQFSDHSGVRPVDSPGYVQAVFENDFFNKKDWYYSNGLELRLSMPTFLPTPLMKAFGKTSKGQYDDGGLVFQHRLFTPYYTNVDDVIVGDRPYSSYWVFGIFRETRWPDRKLSNWKRLSIGIIGQLAGGRELQSAIHEMLPGSEPPKGWQYQIRNDAIIDFRTGYEKAWISNHHVLIGTFVDGAFGTLRNYVGMGPRVRMGQMPEYFSNTVKRNWSVYFEGRLAVTRVFHNATLEGGYFNDSPFYRLQDVQVHPWLNRLEMSLVFQVGQLEFKASQHLVSPEFEGGKGHSYGGISLRYFFSGPALLVK